MRTLFGLPFLILFVSSMALGQEAPPAFVEATVDRTEITIGDPIEYTVTLEYANGVEVEKPAWGEGLDAFQILEFDRGEPEKQGNRWRAVDHYRLSTFTPEDYTIPPLRIPIALPSGATQALETQPIAIKVKSILPEDEESLSLRELKDPVPVYSGLLTGRILAALGAAAAIALLLWLVWRRRNRMEEATAPEPQRPEHELALERLAVLRSHLSDLEETPPQEFCKSFGLDLSETLRTYLQSRYHFYALDLTTREISEILPTLMLRNIGNDSGESLILRILDGTDLLKFAKATLPAKRLSELLETTEDVIHLTKRTDASPQGEAPPEGENEERREVA